jgi:CheY-like chemotaxis protein
MLLNIMIVEDELLVALELERIAEGSGHNVVAIVATVDQALAYAAKADIAFVDIRLAGGDNGALLARRLIDRFHIKVIFVTANPSEIRHGLEGAVDLIGKPFTDDRVLAGLSKAAGANTDMA